MQAADAVSDLEMRSRKRSDANMRQRRPSIAISIPNPQSLIPPPMPPVEIEVACPVFDSFRVQQVGGMFDVPLAQRASERFRVDVPRVGAGRR